MSTSNKTEQLFQTSPSNGMELISSHKVYRKEFRKLPFMKQYFLILILIKHYNYCYYVW